MRIQLLTVSFVALLLAACIPVDDPMIGTPWPSLAPRATITPLPSATADPQAGATPVLAPTGTLPPGAAARHTLADGETAATVAQYYGIPVDVLLAYNALPESAVGPGTTLLIPAEDTVVELLPTPFPTVPLELLDNPLREYSIDYLLQRTYFGGEISTVEGTTFNTSTYQQRLIRYETDEGIAVTGLAHIPLEGDPPFPVIILLHGGFDQDAYYPGLGTLEHATFFVQHGYVVIAPDYRSYNDSDGTGTPLKIPWSIDVVNLIDALPTMPEADPTRIGLMGHSRGGGVGSYIAVLTPVLPGVRAISLYNSLSFDQAVNWYHYVNAFDAEWPITDSFQVGNPSDNADGYGAVSPINYLDYITVPVQIHHGQNDTVLPVDWARDLNERMIEAGVDVAYFEYPEANHSFVGEDLTLFWERNLAFFDEHVKDAPDLDDAQ
ncbi:MAG: alpha/beta fold hydrolase [Anaerolineae bacterium]